jgi:phosphoribosylanthranilate isomerase
MTRVKICGIKNQAELNTAIRCGADAVGFITEVPVDTPRRISLETAAKLIKQVPPLVESVLVIMPERAEEVYHMANTAKPSMVQLHKDPSYELLEEIQNLRQHIKIIQTVTIPERGVCHTTSLHEYIKLLSPYVDAVLLDTLTTKGTGGTGKTHNWQISREIVEQSPLPVILAGGLNPENVEDAIRAVKPFAVDTASGVETQGVKDEHKVKAFIRRAKCRVNNHGT